MHLLALLGLLWQISLLFHILQWWNPYTFKYLKPEKRHPFWAEPTRMAAPSLYTAVLFFFVLFKDIKEFASEASARERARSAITGKIKNYFLLPPPLRTPLRWRSINPSRFTFYHPRSTDFEEKIEGLWTGYVCPITRENNHFLFWSL